MADEILGSFTTDAVILSPDLPGSFDVSASVPGWGDFGAWAVVQREMAGSFVVWASIPGWSDFTVDAVIARTIDGVRGAPPIWSDTFTRTLTGTWGGDWANTYTNYGGVNGDHVYASGATRYAYSYIPLLDTLTEDPVDSTIDVLTPAAGGGTDWRVIFRLRKSYFQIRALNPPVLPFEGAYEIFVWSGGVMDWVDTYLDASTWYRVRMQCGQSETRLKIWKADELEPSGWLVHDLAVGVYVTNSYLSLDAYGNDARADNAYIWPLGYDSYYEGIQVDAAIYPRHFRADATLFKEMDWSKTIDAVRGQTFETTGIPVEYEWGPGGSFTIAAVILATVSRSSYADVILLDGPLHYWRLDETSGTTAVDRGSQPRHGTIKSGVTLGVPTDAPAPPGRAFFLPGNSSTGYVYMDDVSVSYPAYSVEAWAKISSESGSSGIVSRGYSPGMMLYSGGSNVTFYHNGSGVVNYTPIEGSWHHVVGVFDGTGTWLFVDGVAAGPNWMEGAAGDNYVFAIGTYNASASSGVSAITGLVSEVAFYDYALTPDQITGHLNYAGGTTTILVDAVICYRNFKADAALFKEMPGSFAANAVLRDTFSFGPVPVDYEWGPGGWFDLDSIRFKEILGAIGLTPPVPAIAPNDYQDAIDWFPSLSVDNESWATAYSTTFLNDDFLPVWGGTGRYRGWIKVVIPAGGSLAAQFDTNGSTYDTVLTIYQDGVGSVLTGDDDGGLGSCSLLTTTLDGGHTYYILCSSYSTGSGTMVMRITPTAVSGQTPDYTVGIHLDAIRGQTFTPAITVDYEWGPGGSFTIDAILLATFTPTSLAPSYWSDDFNRVVALGWGGTWTGQGYASYASVDGAQGRVTGNNYSYANNATLDAAMVGVSTWDATVEFRTPPVGGSTSWRFQWRVPDSYFYLYPYTTIASPTSAYRVYLIAKGASTNITTFQVAPDTWYRARLQQDAGTSYLKIWKLTDPEPGTWLLSRAQTSSPYPAYLSVSNYSNTSYTAFDNMAVWQFGKWGPQPGFTVDAYYEWLHFHSYATFLRTQVPAAKTIDAVKRVTQTGTPFVIEYEWGPGGAITLDAVILATVLRADRYGKIINSTPDAFWPFGDATTASATEVMAGNTATPVTPANITTDWVDGIGKGWRWTAATYLNTPFYQPSTYAATFEGWIKVSAASPGELWQGRYGSLGGGGRGITVAMNASGYGTVAGRINFFLNTDNVWRGVTTSNAYNDNKLHHVVCVFDSGGADLDGNQFKVYVDGYQVTAPVTSTTGTISPPYAGRGANGQFLGRNYGAFTGGFASHFAFYSRALTPDEILDHYIGVGFQVQALLIPMFFTADAFFIGTVYRDVAVNAVITRTWDPSDGMVIPVDYEWGPGGEFVPSALKLRIQEGFGDLVFPGWDSLGVGPGGRANMLTPVPVRAVGGQPFSITFTAISDGGNIGFFSGATPNLASANQNVWTSVGALPFTFTAEVKAGNSYVWPYSWLSHNYRPDLTGAGYHVPGRVFASAVQLATITVYGTLFLTEDDPNRHGTIDAFYCVVYGSWTTLEALVLAIIPGVIRADAVIEAPVTPAAQTADAVFLTSLDGSPFTLEYEWGPGGWFGLDAIPLATIDDSSSWIDTGWADPSLFRKTAFGVGAWISAVFTTDAEIWPLHFWARASIGLWFWAEAEIVPPHFHTDAVKRKTLTGTPFTLDARIVGTVYGSFVARAVKRETITGTPFTLDADKSGRLDLFATKMRDTWGALRVEAQIKRTWLKDFAVDYEWGPGGDFTLNAYRQPYFFVDAELCLAFVLDATILAWRGPSFLTLTYPGTSESLLGQTVNALTPQFSVGPDELMNVTVTAPPSDGGILGAFRLGSIYNYDIPAVAGEYSFPVLPGEYVIYSAQGNVFRPSLTGSGTYRNWGISTLGIAVDAFVLPTFRVDAAIVWIITPTPFTVGAWFKRIWVYGFPAGAFVLPWFTLDATYVPRHFHASAWLIRRPGGSFTANAFIEWRHFHANAVRKATQLASFRLNAFFDHPIYGDFNVYSRINWYFPVAAAVTVVKYRKFTVSAVKRWLVQPPIADWDRWWAYPPVLPVVSAFVQPYFRVNARIFRMEFFLSAVILRTQEKPFTANANFVWTFLGSTTANAFVQPWFKLYAIRRWEPDRSLNVMAWMVRLVVTPFTVNAELRGTWAKAVIFHPDMRGVFTFYAVKAASSPARTFIASAEKIDPGAYWDPETETWLYPHFSVDAGIAFFTGGSFVVDAAIVEEGLVIHSFVPSAMIFGERTDMFWIEAMVDAEKTIIYDRDGYTEQVLTTFVERLTFPGWNDSIGGGSNRVSSIIDTTAEGERVSFTVWDWGWNPVDGSSSLGFVSVHENLWTNGPTGGGHSAQGVYQAYGNTYSFIPQYPNEPHNAYVWTSVGGYQPAATGDVMMTYKRWLTVARTRPAPTIDAFLVGTSGEPFTLDAEIVEYEKLHSFVLHAESAAAGEHRGQVGVDASILGSVSTSWWVDAILEGLHFHVDAVIHQPSIAVSAHIQPYFRVDAIVLYTRSWVSGLPTINAVKYLPTRTGSFTVGADINVTGQPRGLLRLDSWILANRGWRIYVIAYIQAPDWSFGVDARVAPYFTASAYVQPYFSVSAQIRGDSYIIFPDDGGDPTDAHGNPPQIGRSFKVKIEAFIPDEVPVGNDAEIERLIWLILEAEAELDAMYCAYTHYSPQDQTTSASHGYTNPNQAGTGRLSTLPGALSQVGYPGAGDIDDCWAVATIWAANAAGYSYRPNMSVFRAAARNPDRPGPTGGTLDHVMRGARGCYPSATIRRYHSTSWDGFISLLKAGWIGSLAVLSSALPSDLHYGFHGRHQIGVAYQNGTYYVMNPLQRNGARPDAISGADLRRAARGFTGGTISACLFS